MNMPRAAIAVDYIVYVGTYTGGESKGIYRLQMNGETGELTMLGVTEGIAHPSFLALHPNGQYLYSVSEVADADGGSGGAITAFAINPETHELTYLNHQSSGGAGPCHVTVAGNHVLSANYGGGSVCVHPIRDDGSLGDATAFAQHVGSSVNTSRQEGPHAHSINVAANGTLAVCADLGLDQLLLYDLDPESGALTARKPGWVALAPGAGPRHFAFHPTRGLAFSINELDSTITSFVVVEDEGLFHPVQTISTLPHPVEGNSTADIHVHPSGKFVYGSNRVHNSIACFSLDEATGILTLIEHESTQGEIPRNFGIDPLGKFLLAENQDSGTIVVFSIDQETGALNPTGHSIEVPMPVCAVFLPLE
jgi:6-phosphogluconolactonase